MPHALDYSFTFMKNIHAIYIYGPLSTTKINTMMVACAIRACVLCFFSHSRIIIHFQRGKIQQIPKIVFHET